MCEKGWFRILTRSRRQIVCSAITDLSERGSGWCRGVAVPTASSRSISSLSRRGRDSFWCCSPSIIAHRRTARVFGKPRGFRRQRWRTALHAFVITILPLRLDHLYRRFLFSPPSRFLLLLFSRPLSFVPSFSSVVFRTRYRPCPSISRVYARYENGRTYGHVCARVPARQT